MGCKIYYFVCYDENEKLYWIVSFSFFSRFITLSMITVLFLYGDRTDTIISLKLFDFLKILLSSYIQINRGENKTSVCVRHRENIFDLLDC